MLLYKQVPYCLRLGTAHSWTYIGAKTLDVQTENLEGGVRWVLSRGEVGGWSFGLWCERIPLG